MDEWLDGYIDLNVRTGHRDRRKMPPTRVVCAARAVAAAQRAASRCKQATPEVMPS